MSEESERENLLAALRQFSSRIADLYLNAPINELREIVRSAREQDSFNRAHFEDMAARPGSSRLPPNVPPNRAELAADNNQHRFPLAPFPPVGWYGLHLAQVPSPRWWRKTPAYLFRSDDWRSWSVLKEGQVSLCFSLPFWPGGAGRMNWKTTLRPGGLHPYKVTLANRYLFEGWEHKDDRLFPMSFEWLQTCGQPLLKFRPISRYGPREANNVAAYLDAVFGADEGRIDNGVLPMDLPAGVDAQPMPPHRWGIVFSGLRYKGLDAWAITRGTTPRRETDRWFAHFRRASSTLDEVAVLFVYNAWTGIPRCFLHFRPDGAALILEQGVFNRDVCGQADVKPEAVDALIREIIA